MDPFKKAEFDKYLKDTKNTEPQFIEICNIAARQLKHYYDALIDMGFTAEQALEIIKEHGCHPGKF